MKLYATTTSERATKGQGGNEYLYIKVMVRDGQKDIELVDFYVHETITDFEIIDNHKCEVIAKVLKLERNTKGKSECPNGGIHRWHKPYANEDIHKCSMCDKVKGETKGKSQKGDI